jgi:hypothetical protein
MSTPSGLRRSWAVVGAAALLACAPMAPGQNTPPPNPNAPEEVKIKPPVPAVPRNEPSDILGIVFAVILGAAVVGVNAIPGRRSHQD